MVAVAHGGNAHARTGGPVDCSLHGMVRNDLPQAIVAVDMEVRAALGERAKLCRGVDPVAQNLPGIVDNAPGAVGVDTPQVGFDLDASAEAFQIGAGDGAGGCRNSSSGGIKQAIQAVVWPRGNMAFVLNPSKGRGRGEGNGVRPIKISCMETLKALGWNTRLVISHPATVRSIVYFSDIFRVLKVTHHVHILY